MCVSWSCVAEDVASTACRKLSSRMAGRVEIIELRLELGGRFPYCAAQWVVDPQSVSLGLEVTRARIMQALEHQPVPFEGDVRVVAAGLGRGATLCQRFVRVQRGR